MVDLPATGRANDADELLRLNFETDVSEYGRGGIVSEGNVFEFDVASERFGFQRTGLLGGDTCRCRGFRERVRRQRRPERSRWC